MDGFEPAFEYARDGVRVFADLRARRDRVGLFGLCFKRKYYFQRDARFHVGFASVPGQPAQPVAKKQDLRQHLSHFQRPVFAGYVRIFLYRACAGHGHPHTDGGGRRFPLGNADDDRFASFASPVFSGDIFIFKHVICVFPRYSAYLFGIADVVDLRIHDCLYRSTEYTDVIFFQHTTLVKRHGGRLRGVAAGDFCGVWHYVHAAYGASPVYPELCAHWHGDCDPFHSGYLTGR